MSLPIILKDLQGITSFLQAFYKLLQEIFIQSTNIQSFKNYNKIIKLNSKAFLQDILESRFPSIGRMAVMIGKRLFTLNLKNLFHYHPFTTFL